jgi:hypothetical protein
MNAATIWLQVGYAMGFAGIPVQGSKRKWLPQLGWALGLVSEVCFTFWATLSHIYSAYPWILAWAGVYGWNWLKWRHAH